MPEAVSFVTQKRKKTFVREFELAMGGGGEGGGMQNGICDSCDRLISQYNRKNSSL